MNKLITASLVAKDISKLVEFPHEILGEYELGIIKWILEYSSKYGEPPTVERLEEEFTRFISYSFDVVPPLGDIYDQTLQAKVNDYVLLKLDEAKESVYSTGALDIGTVRNVMRAIGMSSGISKQRWRCSRPAEVTCGSISSKSAWPSMRPSGVPMPRKA